MSEDSPTRRIQRAIITMAVATVALFLVVVGLTLWQRAALCSFYGDLEQRRDNSQMFLDMTLEERVEKYGPELGRIPTSTIENQVVQQTKTLESLSLLHCG